MTNHILQAYETDIDFRIHGFEKANESGYRVEVTEIESGIVYRDDLVTVEAFPVSHGTLECYGYKFTTPDRTIVITGDTAPLDLGGKVFVVILYIHMVNPVIRNEQFRICLFCNTGKIRA